MLIAIILLCRVQCPAQKFFQEEKEKLGIVRDTCGDCEEIEREINSVIKVERISKRKIELKKFRIGFKHQVYTIRIKKFVQRNFSHVSKQKKFLKVTCYKW